MYVADSERCRSCFYRAKYCVSQLGPHCDHILITGEARGCPVEGCTRYRKARRTLADEHEKIRALYEQGWNDREIGEALGFATSSIALWRKRHWLPPKAKDMAKNRTM